MAIKYFLSGFFAKIIAGFDDTLTRIPILSHITRTKKGKILFLLGVFLAIFLAILFSFFFGNAIKAIPYSNIISSLLIVFLSFAIYFDWFIQKPRKNTERRLSHMKAIPKVKVVKLIFVGFLTAFATVIDDAIVYSGLFIGDLINVPYIVAGIFLATVLQLIAVYYFSDQLNKIKYKKEITFVGLIVLALLIFLKII
jgi:hypothetical protein